MEAAKGLGDHMTRTLCALAVTECLQGQGLRLHHPDPKHTARLTEVRSMCETSLAALTLGNR